MYQFNCSCEMRKHKVPLEMVEISDGAIGRLPELLRKYHRIFMVADENTYKAAGEQVENVLKKAGKFSHKLILQTPALPTEQTVGCVILEAGGSDYLYDIMKFSPLPDYILAVGSGTVNDTCRVASYRLHLPYGVVATAPSMDGYSSGISPMIYKNTKTTFKGTTPRHICADLSVAANAPYELLLAGVGDMAGKYVALLDWELAHLHTGEYYCKTVADMVKTAADRCIGTAYQLKDRDFETVENLMEGLIVSGLGMAYTGVSRPASGAEHMIAHTWEMMDIQEGHMPNLHGLEVGEGTLAAANMYRRLHSETDDGELRALIGKYLPYFDELERVYRAVHIPLVVKDKQKLVDGILSARTFRKRYTLLEYLAQKGLLETYAQDCADQVLQALPEEA